MIILRSFFAAWLVLAALGSSFVSAEGRTLRAVMYSDLKILDPIWTTSYIVRNHGYMIYDTLFATDAAGEIKLQMLERHDVSADQLAHTFVLRKDLIWHDGKPVTSEDCIASIKRWAAKDPVGQRLMTFVVAMTATDASSFVMTLKEPTGLVTIGLGKPSSNVPFMMPKRVAETDPNVQISDFTGSGPFVFKKDEWRPGDKTVYVKFDGYRPRPEPALGQAGGKVVKVDRVEWLAISDVQQAVNALLASEVDYLERAPHDLLPILKAAPDVRIVDLNPLGSQFNFRPNWLHKPFDNPKIREAAFYALNQEDFLKAVVGDPQYYKVCKSFYICGTPLYTERGMEPLLTSNLAKARILLKEANYDGTPVVLMNATDIQNLANLGPVAKSLLEKGGFTVDLQSMDWSTLVSRRAKKDAPAAGGWNAFMTSWVSADVLNPIYSVSLSASCDKAAFGWPCDAEIERLRDQFAREADPSRQKAIAEQLQMRAAEMVTHIPLGQMSLPSVMRKNVQGVLVAPVPVFWNVSID